LKFFLSVFVLATEIYSSEILASTPVLSATEHGVLFSGRLLNDTPVFSKPTAKKFFALLGAGTPVVVEVGSGRWERIIASSGDVRGTGYILRLKINELEESRLVSAEGGPLDPVSLQTWR
jgi:hypothetical protein